jgi:hypothetical protein
MGFLLSWVMQVVDPAALMLNGEAFYAERSYPYAQLTLAVLPGGSFSLLIMKPTGVRSMLMDRTASINRLSMI